jgi:glutamate synthase (NADPH/NADH) large chain
MSGGRAFVYDDQGDFGDAPLQQGTASIWSRWCCDDDVAEVRGILERHRDLTGSPRAAWVLEHWADAQQRFIKVFPHEYKRVLGYSSRGSTARLCPPIPSSPQGGGNAEVQHG